MESSGQWGHSSDFQNKAKILVSMASIHKFFGQNTYLLDATKLEQQIIITAFAAQVRIGY
eukprot:615104-Ditylum_brightwellii.AAC.1